jgi:crotonobetainyl-CoA:carnitine CoA-transferase CaiB-like acyl-CoA transferase
MLWNYDDQDEPAGGTSIFPDHLCGRIGALGALAALLGREGAGSAGRHVELAQVEVTVGIVGDLLTKEALEPGSVRATGNRRERGAPWGLFRCAGTEQWAAITCRDDDDWARLVEVMGSPSWAKDPDLTTAARRHARVDEVEAGVRAWTADLSREDVVARCQAAGVPAGEMLTALESAELEHFVARGFPVEIEQPGMVVPKLILDGPGFMGSLMAQPVITKAPALGEHTREICRDLLGMNEDDIERLVKARVLEVTPPPA